MVKTRKTDTNGEDIEPVETGTRPRKDQQNCQMNTCYHVSTADDLLNLKPSNLLKLILETHYRSAFDQFSLTTLLSELVPIKFCFECAQRNSENGTTKIKLSIVFHRKT
jgi:hypothetical protein